MFFSAKWLKKGNQGYMGGFGFGGSSIHWHPELKIGYGYARTGVRYIFLQLL